jgi:pimeloyl-ACP methyl ester carboxylesterase
VRDNFNTLIWKNVSPKWPFDDATFDRTAASFNDPDHVAIVIHNYRWRQSLAKILKGIGHNVPQEAPQAFAEAIVEVDGY